MHCSEDRNETSQHGKRPAGYHVELGSLGRVLFGNAPDARNFSSLNFKNKVPPLGNVRNYYL